MGFKLVGSFFLDVLFILFADCLLPFEGVAHLRVDDFESSFLGRLAFGPWFREDVAA